MLVIGASTGGPPVLSKLLRALPAPFPLPICIVQHMTRDFVPGFARWIAEDTGLPVSLVSDRAAAQSGVVYIPVADHHLLLESRARLTASAAGPNGPYRPSIDVFFESVARTDAAGSIGVLLTGMGSDGAQGLAKLRAAGARTLVQEPDSCAVAGMPSRAIALGAAEQILHPDALPAAIVACAAQAAASRARL
jgi:chemotaxis response regulator CheB